MKKTLLTIALCGGCAFAAHKCGGIFAPAVYAEAQRALTKCSVPKAYGAPKLMTGWQVGFEDENETIRFVNVADGCKVELIVERQ